MQFSQKERSLIEIFLSSKRSLTAKEIAANLNVSTKTVYRLVKKLNELSNPADIIQTQSGKGLSLHYDNYLKLVHNPAEIQDQNSEGRRNRILLELLFRSPNFIDFKQLYAGQYVSEELIYKDLEKIQETAEVNQLTLQKKGLHVAIEGPEIAIRNLSYTLISVASFLTSETYVVNNGTIHPYDVDFITSLLEMIERTVGSGIPYPYNVNIFSHLYILLSRFRNGKVNDAWVEKIETLDQEEQNLILQNQEKFNLAQKVIERINAYLCTKVSEIETFYLFQYILSSRVAVDVKEQDLSKQYEQIEPIAVFLANQLEKEMQTSFQAILKDNEFQEHLRLMLYRSQNGIIIKNEMKSDIKREYSRLYVTLQKVTGQLSNVFQIAKVSEDEIGFLVLYFAKILEQEKFKKRVLIMCSSGVGTSELLKVKVKKAFPNLIIVDVVSLNQYKKKYERAGEELFDFILTTVNVKKKSKVPCLLVNFMFTQQDQENVLKLLEGL